MNDSCEKLISRGGWTEDATLKRCTPPIGPRNAWSNIAYPVAGMVAFLNQPSSSSFVFAITMLALGTGSFLYHSEKTILANNFDWAGMYASMLALTFHAIFPAAPGLAFASIFFGVTIVMLFAFQKIHYDIHMGIFFLFALGGTIAHGSHLHAIIATILFAIAYLSWQLDTHHAKIIGLWGHAFWHIFAAAAQATLFMGVR